MALQKAKTLLNGAQGNYWKIIDISFDRTSMRLSCNIALFASKDYSKIANLGLVKNFVFSVSKDQAASDIAALAYTLIKAKANEPAKDLFGKPDPNKHFDEDLYSAQDA